MLLRSTRVFGFAAVLAALSLSAPAQAPVLSGRDLTLGTPARTGSFDLIPGHRVSLDTSGTPGEVAALLLSAGRSTSPIFIGGVRLVVDPNALVIVPQGVVGPRGTASVALQVPLNTPAATVLFGQSVLVDPALLALRLSTSLTLPVTGEPLRTVSRGTLSGHPLAQTASGGALVIRDGTTWNAFWAQHQSIVFPPPPPPVIDFSREAVVAVFVGWRPTGGHSVVVEQVRQTASAGVRGLRVDGQQTFPGRGCAVTQVITHPFHLVAVPAVAASGPVLELNLPSTAFNCR